jgi:imidazolonepropionase-like amidohydrolase
MRRACRIGAAAFAAAVWIAAWWEPAAGQAPPRVTLFEGARLITGDGKPPLLDAAFLVEGDRLAAIGRRGALTVPAGAARVDLAGKTVIPALIDAHSHIGYLDHRRPGAPEQYTRDNLVDHLRRYAYYGVAATLSLGIDQGELAFELRDRPVAGAALLRTAWRGIASPKTGPSGEARRGVPYEVTTEAEARAAVGELAARRVDIVKIWVDDRGRTAEKLSPSLYRAVIDEAHARGLRVVAHVYYLEDAKDLLRAGIDGFAHGVRDRDIDEEFIEWFKARPQVFLIPNLPDRGGDVDWASLGETLPPEELARMQEAQAKRTPETIARARELFGIQARNLARLYRAGVTIGFGTDGNGAGWQVHTELEDMVAAGMSPADVLVAATRTSAAILRLDRHGTLAPGKSADFVVLDGNPLDDIRQTRRIAAVYLRGERVDREALRAAWTSRARVGP